MKNIIHHNRIIQIILIIVLLILLFRALHTPTPSPDKGMIAGKVTLDGVLYPGIRVTLFNANQTEVIAYSDSDVNGMYAFAQVPYGNYHIQAYKEYENGTYVIADADITLSVPVIAVDLALV